MDEILLDSQICQASTQDTSSTTKEQKRAKEFLFQSQTFSDYSVHSLQAEKLNYNSTLHIMQVYTAIPLGAMENSNNSSSDEGFMSRVRSRNTDGKLKVLIGLLLVIVTLVIIVVSTQPHHHSHHHKQHKSLLQYNTPYPYSAHEESRIQKMMQQRENMAVQSHGPRYLRSSPVVVVVTKSTPSSPRMLDMMSPSQQLMNAHSMNMSFESLFEHDMNSSIQSMMQMMNVMEQEMMRDFHHMNRVLDSVIGESPSVEDHFMRPCSMRMPHLVQVLNEPKVDAVPVTAAVTSNNGIVEEKQKNAGKDLVKAKAQTVDVVPEVEQEDTVTTTTDNTPETVEFPDEDSLPDFNAEFPDEDSLPDFDGAEEHAVPELVSHLSAVEDLR